MNANVSLSTDINPGTFSLTLANPFEQYVDDSGSLAFYTGDTIRVYATRRFQSENRQRYVSIFWGIIEQVVDDYSDGAARFTLSGQDISAWLQYTMIRTAPTVTDLIHNSGLTVNPYGHKYANQPVLSIIADVIFNDIRDFNTVKAYDSLTIY